MMRKNAATSFLMCLGSLAFFAAGQAAPVLNPTNNHYYEAVSVSSGISWTQANIAAQALTYQGSQGHLVSITSAQENQFVYQYLIVPSPTREFWIGAYQDTTAPDYSEPAGGFRWTTGEPFSYANWREGEPNNALGYGAAENHVHIKEDGEWNDIPQSPAIDKQYGYIVEYDAKPNEAPIAQADAATVVENSADNAINVLGNDSDPDGDTLTIVSAGISTAPQHGDVAPVGPEGAYTGLTYTPDADYVGSDTFEYTISDGQGHTATALVTVTVKPFNNAPVAKSDTFYTKEDDPVAVYLSARDAEGDPLTYSIVTQPTRGILTSNGTTLTYRPNPNVNGADSFTFKANDGNSDSNIAKISLAISGINDAPVARSQSVQLKTNATLYITLLASDVDNPALTYNIITPPSHGTLSSGTGGVRLYTPARGYSGDDLFTFQVSDGNSTNGLSNIATVYITVKPNQAPIARNQNVMLQEDTPVAITLGAGDADDNTLFYTIVTQPTKGTLSGSGINYSYTPNANVTGADSFTFKASDGNSDSNVATVALAISGVNDAPVAQNQSVSTPMNRAMYITLKATDVDSGGLTYTLVSAPTHGTLTGSGASYKYTPAAGYTGSDSLSFKASDGNNVNGTSNTATVSISVTP